MRHKAVATEVFDDEDLQRDEPHSRESGGKTAGRKQPPGQLSLCWKSATAAERECSQCDRIKPERCRSDGNRRNFRPWRREHMIAVEHASAAAGDARLIEGDPGEVSADAERHAAEQTQTPDKPLRGGRIHCRADCRIGLDRVTTRWAHVRILSRFRTADLPIRQEIPHSPGTNSRFGRLATIRTHGTAVSFSQLSAEWRRSSLDGYPVARCAAVVISAKTAEQQFPTCSRIKLCFRRAKLELQIVRAQAGAWE